MIRFLKNCHLPENLEVLFMLVFGILLQMADGSPFSLKERWILVWETELPAENFSPLVQKFIKILLSMIVAVRSVTTYAYVLSAMLVIFCLLRSTAPKLMLLWLLVAGVKSVCMTFLEALTGVYVCSAFGKIRKACIEFFISKALEIIFAAYLWGSVLNIYQDIERKSENVTPPPTKEQMFIQKVDFGRQRARSLVDESTLYKTACLNNFEFKDVPQIILQMLREGDALSQDSLLGPGMMLASVSNLGSFDNLKTSQSLGELGFMDLGTTQVVGLEEDEDLTHQEKALRFLKLTRSDVKQIQLNKSSLENDIYNIDKDTWTQVESNGAHISKPKQARTQIFIRDILQTAPSEETTKKIFGFTFSNLFNDKPPSIDEEQDEDFVFSHEEDEGDDDEPVQLFMSNLKEGVIIHPNRLGIVFKKTKGNAYSELYRQDFMSVIGPEVFDRASKLPKVNFIPAKENLKSRSMVVAMPAIADLKEDESKLSKNDSKDIISQTSCENLPTDDYLGDVESSSGVDTICQSEKDLERTGLLPVVVYGLKKESDEPESVEMHKTCSDDSGLSKSTNDSLPLFGIKNSCEEIKRKPLKKRKIIIRRVGKKSSFWNSSSDTQKNSKPCPDAKSDVKKNDEVPHKESKKQNPILEVSDEYIRSEETNFGSSSQQTYFLSELLHKPLIDVLMTYYDLKMNLPVQKKSLDSKSNEEFFNIALQNYQPRRSEKILQNLDISPNQKKVWKSSVLKTADNVETPFDSLKTILSIIKGESLLRRLSRFEYARSVSRNINYWDSINEFCLSRDNYNDLSCPDCDTDSVHTSDDKLESELHSSSDIDLELSETGGDSDGSSSPSGSENPTEVNLVSKKMDGYPLPKRVSIEKPTKEVLSESEVATSSIVSMNDQERESISSQESDEPISLYYSKAANLASPLFDMKRFIYPDHIHYSYKHVKKKGFDVDINGGFPLLMRESLTMEKMGSRIVSQNPQFEITRRPMDLSFATTHEFAEWQNNDVDVPTSEKRIQKHNKSSRKEESDSSIADLSNCKKMKKTKRLKKNSNSNDSHSSFKSDSKSKPKPHDGDFNNIKYLYSTKDYALIEKLLKMHVQFNSNNFDNSTSERKPVQISSTQLHSNKGRINSTYNPAIFLQENKTRNEKKKIETQEKRTKDMFARLEREVLLQSKNVQKSFGPNRNN